MRQGSEKKLTRNKNTKWDVAGYILDESVVTKPLALPEVFGNARPVEIEIGSGKGGFLLARAAARPEINFIGVEWAKAYCHYTADRVRRAGLANTKMLRADAEQLFKVSLADNSLIRVHIYFPDPWPKRRHHRRRLVQPRFISELCRVLRPGGELLIVTDHLEYFRHIKTGVDATKGLARIGFPVMTDEDGEVVGTNFERKYIAQGRPFYKLARMLYV